MLEFILNIILLIGILGILIFVHELGHFLFAKFNNVKVSEFALGMGPVIYSKTIGETKWALRAFPIGGFVNILGEVESDDKKLVKEAKESPRSFLNKGPWQKISILFGGVLFNFLLAGLIYYFVIGFNGFVGYTTDIAYDKGLAFGEVSKMELTSVFYYSLAEDGNAKKAGLPEIGEIKVVNGEEIQFSDDFSKQIKENKGGELDLEVCPINEKLESTGECNDYTVAVSDEGLLGVYLGQNYAYGVEYTGLDKFFVGFTHSINTIQMNFQALGAVFEEAEETGDYSEAANTLGGPVALYFIVDYVNDIGFLGMIELLATLNLTLFIVNLLPIPAMDGGRIVLVGVRSLLGDRFSHKLEATLVGVSFMLLMLLMVGIIVKDIFFIDTFRELLGK
jgi:regulator of sigma E protease